MVSAKQRIVVCLALMLAVTGSARAEDRVPDGRPTAEITRDLKGTQHELDKLQDLQAKLDQSSRQSSNAARSAAVDDLESFMRRAVKRLEHDLGRKMTLKQQGEAVTSGTTEVAEVGSPVPTNRRKGGRSLYDVSDGDRLHVLLNMQTLQVSATNISRPASEGQQQAFAQYTATVNSFSQQLSALVKAMTAELASREIPEEK